MTPLDDHSQRRRPLFFPVVIATALLTIIGMVGGYLLGQERNRSEPGPVEPSPTISLIAATGPACPAQTQKMGSKQGADGELRQVLWVRTSRKTQVWICEDRSGRLFYHANKGGTGAEWIEGKTALFLRDVWIDSDNRFVAQAFDGNIFSVDRERLLISHADGEQEEQKVVES